MSQPTSSNDVPDPNNPEDNNNPSGPLPTHPSKEVEKLRAEIRAVSTKLYTLMGQMNIEIPPPLSPSPLEQPIVEGVSMKREIVNGSGVGGEVRKRVENGNDKKSQVEVITLDSEEEDNNLPPFPLLQTISTSQKSRSNEPEMPTNDLNSPVDQQSLNNEIPTSSLNGSVDKSVVNQEGNLNQNGIIVGREENESSTTTQPTPQRQICKDCRLPKEIYSIERCRYCCMQFYRRRPKNVIKTELEPAGNQGSMPNPAVKRKPGRPSGIKKCKICHFYFDGKAFYRNGDTFCKLCFNSKGSFKRTCVVCGLYRLHQAFGRCSDCCKDYRNGAKQTRHTNLSRGVEQCVSSADASNVLTQNPSVLPQQNLSQDPSVSTQNQPQNPSVSTQNQPQDDFTLPDLPIGASGLPEISLLDCLLVPLEEIQQSAKSSDLSQTQNSTQNQSQNLSQKVKQKKPRCQFCRMRIRPDTKCDEDEAYCKICFQHKDQPNGHRICVACDKFARHEGFGRCGVCLIDYKRRHPELFNAIGYGLNQGNATDQPSQNAQPTEPQSQSITSLNQRRSSQLPRQQPIEPSHSTFESKNSASNPTAPSQQLTTPSNHLQNPPSDPTTPQKQRLCADCGELKQIHGHEKCPQCYRKYWTKLDQEKKRIAGVEVVKRKPGRPRKIPQPSSNGPHKCIRCSKQYQITNSYKMSQSYCSDCYDSMNLAPCKDCNQVKRHYAHGKCNTCYSKFARQKTIGVVSNSNPLRMTRLSHQLENQRRKSMEIEAEMEARYQGPRCKSCHKRMDNGNQSKELKEHCEKCVKRLDTETRFCLCKDCGKIRYMRSGGRCDVCHSRFLIESQSTTPYQRTKYERRFSSSSSSSSEDEQDEQEESNTSSRPPLLTNHKTENLDDEEEVDLIPKVPDNITEKRSSGRYIQAICSTCKEFKTLLSTEECHRCVYKKIRESRGPNPDQSRKRRGRSMSVFGGGEVGPSSSSFRHSTPQSHSATKAHNSTYSSRYIPHLIRKCKLCKTEICGNKISELSRTLCVACIRKKPSNVTKCGECEDLCKPHGYGLCKICYRFHYNNAKKMGISAQQHIQQHPGVPFKNNSLDQSAGDNGSGNGFNRHGSAFNRSGSVVNRSGNRSGSVFNRSGSTINKSGSIVNESENVFNRSGIRSGSVFNRSKSIPRNLTEPRSSIGSGNANTSRNTTASTPKETIRCQFCEFEIEPHMKCDRTPLVCKGCFVKEKTKLRVCRGCEELCKNAAHGYCRICYRKKCREEKRMELNDSGSRKRPHSPPIDLNRHEESNTNHQHEMSSNKIQLPSKCQHCKRQIEDRNRCDKIKTLCCKCFKANEFKLIKCELCQELCIHYSKGKCSYCYFKCYEENKKAKKSTNNQPIDRHQTPSTSQSTPSFRHKSPVPSTSSQFEQKCQKCNVTLNKRNAESSKAQLCRFCQRSGQFQKLKPEKHIPIVSGNLASHIVKPEPTEADIITID